MLGLEHPAPEALLVARVTGAALVALALACWVGRGERGGPARRGPLLGVLIYDGAAERALRHAVLWRKGGGGTDSNRGSRFVERVLSVRETCRPQGRSRLGSLVECCEASLKGEKAPSLLPKDGCQLGVA